MSSSDESSSGVWLTPPFRLRTKSIALGTPAAARMPASWPAPEASSSAGRPRPSSSSRSSAPKLGVHVRRLRPLRRLEADRGDELVEPLGVGRARVHRDAHATRDDVRCRPARRSSCPTVATAPSIRARRRGSGAPPRPRRRARPRAPAIGVVPACPASALEHELAAHVADDPRDDAERRVGLREHRPLLDVHLEEGRRAARAAAGDERATADAADLLAAEDDDRARARPARPPRARLRRRARRRSGRPAGRSRGATRPDPSARATSGRRGSRPGRPRPRAPPRASSRRRARALRPPRASRAHGWRPGRRRSRRAARDDRVSARGECRSRARRLNCRGASRAATSPRAGTRAARPKAACHDVAETRGRERHAATATPDRREHGLLDADRGAAPPARRSRPRS